MSVGDQTDMFGRLKNLLPAGWFGDNNPIRDALLWGYANALAWGYTLYLYAKDQTRIKSASDGWLDLIGLDFFGNNLVRYSGQSDASYRNRILINIFRERTTRHAMEQVLFDLTGRTPIIIEPARPADVGAYGAAVAVSQPGTTTMIDNGMIVYVPPNTPRYQAGQLLIEGQATNLLKYSEQMDNAVWSKTLVSIAPDSVVAPDLANSMDLLFESNSNGAHFLSCVSSYVAGNIYCLSVFAKEYSTGSKRYVTLLLQSSVFGANIRCTFDLANGATYAQNGPVGFGIVPVGGGASRIFVIGQAVNTASTVSALQIRLSNVLADTLSSYTGDGASGVYVWGANLTIGPLSSYIPTTSAAVTRSADTLLNNMPAGSSGMGGYGAAGAYGSISLPYQAFITAFRPSGQGLPYIAGYGISTGGYSTPSQSEYAEYSDGGVTDADIYAAIAATKPEGTAVWARLSS
jgi:hypothetical protein